MHHPAVFQQTCVGMLEELSKNHKICPPGSVDTNLVASLTPPGTVQYINVDERFEQLPHGFNFPWGHILSFCALIACSGLQTDIIARLTGGDQAGRAAAAKKALEKIKSEEGIVTKPFVPKKRSFAFPTPERMGQRVLEINGLTHGYGDRLLFDKVDLEIEKGERVAIIGAQISFSPLHFLLNIQSILPGLSSFLFSSQAFAFTMES